jgi:hypothetical protein
VGYVAFSVPEMVAGIAVTSIGLARTTELYGGAVIVLALIAAASVAVHLRRAAKPAEPARPESESLAA